MQLISLSNNQLRDFTGHTQILFMLSFLSLPLNHSLNHEIMDKEIPKSELPKPFRKQSIRVSKSHLPGNTSYKGSVVWQRTLSIDDIAARVVDKRSEYRKETLVNSGQRLCFVPGFAFGAGEWEAIVCTQFTPTYHLYKEPRYGTLTFTVM